MLRTAVSNRLAKVQGFLFRAAFLRRVPMFFRLILENILLCFLQSALHSTSKYITGTLSLRFRSILTRLIHAQYFQVEINSWHLPTTLVLCIMLVFGSPRCYLSFKMSLRQNSLDRNPSLYITIKYSIARFVVKITLMASYWHLCIIAQWSYKIFRNLVCQTLVMVCLDRN